MIWRLNRYRALYTYAPQNDDELELQESDMICVLEKCDDGWYVGTSQRTGLFGTFPGNYVERVWSYFKHDTRHTWMNRCVTKSHDKHIPHLSITHLELKKFSLWLYCCSSPIYSYSLSLIYNLIQQQRQRISHLNQNSDRYTFSWSYICFCYNIHELLLFDRWKT